MRQLVAMSLVIVRDEDETLSVGEIKSFLNETTQDLFKSKKVDAKIADGLQVFVMNYKAYDSYFNEHRRYMQNIYNIPPTMKGGIDDNQYGSPVELAIANRLMSGENISKLKYPSKGDEDAMVFLCKICNSKAEEKALRSIREDLQVNYNKYTYTV